jgi:hypothetical protein
MAGELFKAMTGTNIPGVSILEGGPPLLADRVGPPFNPQPTLRAAAQHLTGCTTFASSHLA